MGDKKRDLIAKMEKGFGHTNWCPRCLLFQAAGSEVRHASKLPGLCYCKAAFSLPSVIYVVVYLYTDKYDIHLSVCVCDFESTLTRTLLKIQVSASAPRLQGLGTCTSYLNCLLNAVSRARAGERFLISSRSSAQSAGHGDCACGTSMDVRLYIHKHNAVGYNGFLHVLLQSCTFGNLSCDIGFIEIFKLPPSPRVSIDAYGK